MPYHRGMVGLLVAVRWLSAAAAMTDQSHIAETTTTTTVVKYYNDLVTSLPDLQGKCVAITGTTSGLGYWAAVATARRNASCIILLNRPSARAEESQKAISAEAAAGVAVMTVHCDLESLASVQAAAMEVNKLTVKYGGLDVLALNAGIMDAPDNRTADGFPLEMQTNHHSQFLLTKLLMPSFQAAADAGREVRIATHSSCARGRFSVTEGGGPLEDKYFLKSGPGSLGGSSESARRERYHQSKLANLLFAMALHNKFAARSEQYGKFMAVAAAPGFSATSLNIPAWGKWIEQHALSAPDGACSLLTVMFDPAVKSGDFYEPEHLFNGPPVKVISEGTPLWPRLPRPLLGIRDDESCNRDLQDQMWNATETGLGEKFPVDAGAATFLVAV